MNANRRFAVLALFCSLLALPWALPPQAPPASGQGRYRFRVLYRAAHLPEEAQKVLKSAHGGFAVDRRPGRGEIYFALPGAGLIQISADLARTRLIETPPELRDTNLHNTTIWYAPGGEAYLSFPANQAGRVYTTTLDGRLVDTLGPPGPDADLGHPVANDYFRGRGNFVPTDVEMLDGLLYVATGYSNLDFVLTARLAGTRPPRAVWHDLAFGGKGNGPGEFGTGHGVTVPPGFKRIDVADRPNSEIDRFTRHGQYLGSWKMPAGSWPCDVDYLGRYAVVGALHGSDRNLGAPIYLFEDERLVSTILPKQDLGLTNFQHVHNAVLVERGGKLYLIAQAWNPGDFAVLEQVTD
jgi:hypothetical protein